MTETAKLMHALGEYIASNDAIWDSYEETIEKQRDEIYRLRRDIAEIRKAHLDSVFEYGCYQIKIKKKAADEIWEKLYSQFSEADVDKILEAQGLKRPVQEEPDALAG